MVHEKCSANKLAALQIPAYTNCAQFRFRKLHTQTLAIPAAVAFFSRQTWEHAPILCPQSKLPGY